MRLLTAFLAPLSGGLESTAAAAATTAQTSSNISQISKDFTLQQPAGRHSQEGQTVNIVQPGEPLSSSGGGQGGGDPSLVIIVVPEI